MSSSDDLIEKAIDLLQDAQSELRWMKRGRDMHVTLSRARFFLMNAEDILDTKLPQAMTG